MLTVNVKRDATLFARIKAANKEMIREKAKACNMEEAPFLDMVLDSLRETPEGQNLLAIGKEPLKASVKKEVHKAAKKVKKALKKIKKVSKKVKKSAGKKK